jgi:hypothetical protein
LDAEKKNLGKKKNGARKLSENVPVNSVCMEQYGGSFEAKLRAEFKSDRPETFRNMLRRIKASIFSTRSNI